MRQNKTTYLFPVAMALALPMVLSQPVLTLGQTDAPPSTVGYKGGQVTDVRSTSIEIDDRSYELKGDVVILDHEGSPLELGRIVPMSRVKFHLKEGQIDKMVVTLPQ
jgi:hypothetical protein